MEVWQCNQCAKCSGSCPVSFAMDYLPNQIVRLLQLDLKDTVLQSRSLWLCTGCKICVSRCPHKVDLLNIIMELRREARALSTGKVQAYHEAFLDSVERYGRTSSALALGISNGSRKEIRWPMLKRGKIKVFRGRVHDKVSIKRLFARAKRGDMGD
ncbi:MAG: 4Fe-4S dicluster domain-containing protein [Desulfitobacteriaceae bacterium]